MIICGIIVEYNPFHNGHQLHIEKTREKSRADLIVCVMSGNFVQRGEPAVFDKWSRTMCALKGGADAVIELPLLSAVQSAEGFASGGVKILDAIGADYISFGCETTDLTAISALAGTLAKEPRKYKRALRENLSQGMSFAQARMNAALPDAPKALKMPNAILATEYIKAIKKHKSKLEPIAIQRVGQGYHSSDISTTLSSATAIRSAMQSNHLAEAFVSMPNVCADYIKEQLLAGLTPVFADSFDKQLLYRLRVGGTGYIKTLHEVSEGLENRIYSAAKTCSTRAELIDAIKTKRYTYTRISRILLYALFGITRDMVEKHNRKKVNHMHVLGVAGQSVMSTLADACKVPLVIGKSDYYTDMDLIATDLYALTQKKEPFNRAARDFTQRLIITK
ncbi:MAG: nucleotidyltransferase [Clostridia bacterium]|jgi:predicted nucleotidyltransferase|nr:nucleotidyltransferase [Clostridia bacterium]MBT7122084.1 nucleotidyltransferase [Clostridia bacterium]